MSWSVDQFFTHFFQLFLQFFLETYFCPKSDTPSRHVLITLGSSGAALFGYLFLSSLYDPSLPGYLFYYLIFAGLFLIFTENRLTALVIVLFHAIGSLYIRLCIANFAQIFYTGSIFGLRVLINVSNLLTCILILLFTLLMRSYCRKDSYVLPWNYQVIFLFLLGLLFGFLYLSLPMSDNAQFLFIYMFLFLSVILILYYLMMDISRRQEDHFNSLLTLRELKLKSEYLEDMQTLHQEMRMLRHEQKNILFYLRAMIQQKNYEALDSYAEELIRMEQMVSSGIETGNVLVNSILQQYDAKARKQNIPFCVEAVLPENLPLADAALVSLLSNILDNAFENADPEHPFINVRLQIIVNSYFSVTVENSVSENILEKNPHLATTKNEAAHHGIGSRVIKKIVSDNHGDLQYSCTEDTFRVQILFPLFPE